MQGQEALEQEIKVKSSVGIDVCKSWLDAHVLPAGMSMRVPNTAAGIRTLKRRLAPFDVGLVAVEATGKWHRLLCRSLHASGLAVAVVDPLPSLPKIAPGSPMPLTQLDTQHRCSPPLASRAGGGRRRALPIFLSLIHI